MTPDKLSFHLRRLASFINSSESPSRSLVISAISRLLLASSRTLGLTVRDALMSEIMKAVPGEFNADDYYDTNPAGKGFRDGYISFGIRPMSWADAGIIGGILIQCTYDPQDFKSEEPEGIPEWKGHSGGGGLIELYTTACYYNKLLGGGCADTHSGEGEGSGGGAVSGAKDIGDINILIDAKEKIVETQVESSIISHEIKQIIADILSNPPAIGRGKEWQKKNLVPTGSAKALLQHIMNTGRRDVGKSDIDALSRAQAERGLGTFSQNLEKNMDFFRSRFIDVNMNT